MIFIGKLSVLEPVSSTMYDIKGKNVFITAAGKGIGRGVAEVLAAQGCNIFLHLQKHGRTERSFRIAEK